MPTKFFVKFVRYESGTTESYLIDKKIKFSKPCTFNDYFELGYIHDNSEHDARSKALIAKYLEDQETKQKILEEISKQIHVRSFVDQLRKAIESGKALDSSQETAILDVIAYENVGIACVSDILVLLDNSTSIMFAHYGAQLTGLALIYELIGSNNSIRRVKYLQSNQSSCSAQTPERIHDWSQGNYQEVCDFLVKSDKWSYEAESRLFATPGDHCASEHGLELRAILHTPRLGGGVDKKIEIAEKLASINREYYEGELKIHEIFPSASRYLFHIVDNDHQLLGEWVKEHFVKCRSPDEFRAIASLNSEAFFQNHLVELYESETEALKYDINLMRWLISKHQPVETEFFGIADKNNDNCFFSIKKNHKINERGLEELVLVIDDFYIHDARKWEIAKKLFETLKKYINGMAVYVAVPGEDEMTRQFLKYLGATRVNEIYKLK